MPWFEIREEYRRYHKYVIEAEDETEALETFALEGRRVDEGDTDDDVVCEIEEISEEEVDERWGCVDLDSE